MKQGNIKWLVGVDEAGRGPLAGPVAVGVVLVASDFDWDYLSGVDDSKRLKPEDREAIFRLTQKLKREGKLNYAVSMVSAAVIDKIGIVPAIHLAMSRALKKVTASTVPRSDLGTVMAKLDGGLKAPVEYKNQETIIKGDAKEKVIGLASVMAKVTRDRYMSRVAQKPELMVYDFAQHKGYGTKAHRQAIKEQGLSVEHRRCFCGNIM